MKDINVLATAPEDLEGALKKERQFLCALFDNGDYDAASERANSVCVRLGLETALFVHMVRFFRIFSKGLDDRQDRIKLRNYIMDEKNQEDLVTVLGVERIGDLLANLETKDEKKRELWVVTDGAGEDACALGAFAELGEAVCFAKEYAKKCHIAFVRRVGGRSSDWEIARIVKNSD